MFIEQQPDFTLAADDDQWIVIWHQGGPSYKARRDGSMDPLPSGRRSYFNRLRHAVAALYDRKMRMCENMDDLRANIDRIGAELKRVCSIKEVDR